MEAAAVLSTRLGIRVVSMVSTNAGLLAGTGSFTQPVSDPPHAFTRDPTAAGTEFRAMALGTRPLLPLAGSTPLAAVVLRAGMMRLPLNSPQPAGEAADAPARSIAQHGSIAARVGPQLACRQNACALPLCGPR